MIDLKNKKIVVPGGAGFIGAHLVKALIDRGAQVTIIDDLNDYYNPQVKKDRLNIFLKGYDFEFVKLDVANFDTLNKFFSGKEFDCIVHLAAQAGVTYSEDNPWIYAQTNIFGQINLMEMARRYNIPKFIFASSTAVYGGKIEMPLSESDRTDNPLSLYAATKKSMELIAHSYHHAYGTQVVVLRFFNVYGPWGRPDSVFIKFADRMLAGETIEVRHDGKVKRDFTYIKDIIDAVLSSINYNESGYEIFNLGSNNPQELNTLIGLFEKYFDVKAKRQNTKLLPMEIVNSHADTSKAKKLLNFKKQTDFSDGVKYFVDWYMDYYKGKY